MNFSKLSSIIAIFIGISMIGFWLVAILFVGIPEMKTDSVEIRLHIIAELVTGILLLIGAWGLLRNKGWARDAHLFTLGMLTYTLIVSPGYYFDKGIYPMAVMFGVLLITAICLTIIGFRRNSKNSNQNLDHLVCSNVR
jgi:hypothetical protein